MHVKLVKWTEENKKDLIHICNTVDRRFLSERIPYPYTEESADWWYLNAVSRDGTDGIYRAISVDGEIIGSVTVEPKSDIYRKDTEIGYMLIDEYHGRGITTESVRQICELAFAKLDIVRITGCVCSPNIPSQKVLLKNRFELEGIMKQAVYKNGEICDLHIYGKYKE